MSIQPKKPTVVVIGGGTGTSVVLNGLKDYPLNLYSIITVTDSGGSTGRLRDEFGFIPVGDLRQSIAALAGGDQGTWIRDILLYRFNKGSGLKGHNLGNLILTALQDLTGSTIKAVEVISKIFNIEGHIFPITSTVVELVIEYEDGTVKIGEHILDDPGQGGKKITSVKTSPRARIYPGAKQIIESADLIILGPGDLYGSLLPNLAIEGTPQALKNSRAQILYVCNLMTRYSQTHQYTATDHIREVESYLHKTLDHVIINNQTVPVSIQRKYQAQHEYPVIDDIPNSTHFKTYRLPLLRQASVKTEPSDEVARSYLRHHPQKLAHIIYQVINTL